MTAVMTICPSAAFVISSGISVTPSHTCGNHIAPHTQADNRVLFVACDSRNVTGDFDAARLLDKFIQRALIGIVAPILGRRVCVGSATHDDPQVRHGACPGSIYPAIRQLRLIIARRS